jgi:ribosome maturation factor RimP
MDARLERELQEFLAGLGYELVSLERGGGRRRPLIRLRIDRAGSSPGRSTMTVDDCARVSRAVGEYLEDRPGGEQEYILEVSSPGVERPLVRPRDYRRFAGERVRIQGYRPLHEGSRQLEGELIGLTEEGESEQAVRLRVGEETVEVPLSSIARASLTYDFESDL